MAEYYPLLSRAVAGLRDAPAEKRRAIYERARQALLGQLRSMEPAVPEDAIEREAVALDASITQIEVEIAVERSGTVLVEPAAAQATAVPNQAPSPPEPATPPSREVGTPRITAEVPPPAPQPAAPPAPAPAPAVTAPRLAVPPGPSSGRGTVRPAAPSGGSPSPQPRPAPPRAPPAPPLQTPAPAAPAPAAPSLRASRNPDDAAALPSAPRLQVAAPVKPSEGEEARPATDFDKALDGVASEAAAKEDGFRPAAPRPVSREQFNPRFIIVASVAALVIIGIAYAAWRLRDKPEQLARSRAAMIAAQQAEPQPGKVVQRADGGAELPAATTNQTPAPAQAPAATQATAVQVTSATQAAAVAPAAAPTQAPAPLAPTQPAAPTAAPEPQKQPPTAAQTSDTSAAAPTTPSNTAAPAPAPSAPAPSAPATLAPATSAPDAATQPVQPATPAPAIAPADTAPVMTSDLQSVPVAQSAALLVDAPDDPEKVKTYVGTVLWRADSVSPGQGQPLATVVRADVEVPEVGLKLSMVFQKNTEAQFPASHTIELRFAPQAGNTLGNVKQINVPEMRKDGSPTGDPLMGLPVTITENYFLVGLSRGDATAFNLDLIKARNWFDVPMLLTSGKIAKITFEKGSTGQRVIEQAIQSWQ